MFGRSPVSAPALYGYGYRVIDRVRDRVWDRDMDRVRDRVRVGGLAIAAHSYSGPNRFQWGRKLEFAPYLHQQKPATSLAPL